MKHVTDREHSQALLDAGIEVESYFMGTKPYVAGIPVDGWIIVPRNSIVGMSFDIPAPLPCELMEILPKWRTWEFVTTDSGVTVCSPVMEYNRYQRADTPANALADMAIWLKEQGLLDKPKEEG